MRTKLIMTISMLLLIVGVGCTAVSRLVTPAEIDRKAVSYAVKAGVVDANSYGGYSNLHKAEKLVKDVETAHFVNVFELEQAKRKEELNHTIHSGNSMANFEAGVEREELLFGERGILSLGLSIVGAGAFTGVLGLLRKRPGDMTPQDFESALATASGKTQEELTNKQRQFAQLVSGVNDLVKTFNLDKDTFKKVMNGAQDKQTQVAVAITKKELGI